VGADMSCKKMSFFIEFFVVSAINKERTVPKGDRRICKEDNTKTLVQRKRKRKLH